MICKMVEAVGIGDKPVHSIEGPHYSKGFLV